MEKNRFLIESEIFSALGFSRHKYNLPMTLPEYKVFLGSPEHKGRFEHAIDIAVPNPELSRTVIRAPKAGIVSSGILSNSRWGSAESDTVYLNWINIDVGHDEFYEIAHVFPLEGKVLRVGDKVEVGEPILIAGLNGRITSTDGVPDSHIHFMVGKWTNSDRTDFKSLKIRWLNEPGFVKIPNHQT